MPFITALDKSTIRSIHTGQVITSTESIVKELLENSIDAKANTIDVRLVDDGLQKIEVRDNGCGIALQDRSHMAKQHHTSKLSSFADLEHVKTYGFRGEALSSLCEMSGQVFITTKTKQDTMAICYKLSRNGDILSENVSGSIPHTGTMVSIYQPFTHLPVRRQVAEKSKVNSVRRIHELMVKYGLSHPFTRLSLNQQQNTLGKPKGQPVWIKPSTSSLSEGVRIMYGATLASMVEECSFEESFDQQVDPNEKSTPSPIRLHCLLPSKSSDPCQIFKGERVFIYVDKRPINYTKSDLKELVAMVRQRYKKVLGLEDDSKKIPFMYIDIQSDLGGYDVNIEPDKSVVFFVGKDRLMNAMQQLLDQTYGSFFNNIPVLPTAERHSSNINPTIQEVPNHSPELFPKDIYQSPPLQPTHADSGIHQNSPTETEIDELDDDLDEPAAHEPPLLNDWLCQHSLTDDMYKDPAFAKQSSALATENSDTRNQLQSTTKRAGLDWQIDEASDMITTAPSPILVEVENHHPRNQHQVANVDRQINNESDMITTTPPSPNQMSAKRHPTQTVSDHTNLDWQVDDASDMIMTTPSPPPPTRIQQHLPSSDEEHTNQISNWFAQFRRQSDSDDVNSRKRPATNQYSVSPPPPPQEKRPRLQLSLPFVQTPLSTLEASVPIVSPQLSPNITNATLDPSSSAILSSMIPNLSTQSQQDVLGTTQSSSETTRDIFTSSASTSRRRDIASLFSKNSEPSSSCTQDQEHAISMISTYDQTTTLDSSTIMTDMTTRYNLYRQRYTQLQRKSVVEYHQQAASVQASISNDQQKQSTWNSHLFGNKSNRDLVIVNEGTYSDFGWVENRLGVLNIKMLQQRYKFQTLMKEYELKCGNPLAIPAQIKISDNSLMYGVIISLDKKEENVANDGHGRTQQTYSLITDKRINANGFRVRWRKEPYAHELVVQFTAIADLNGYGPTDFNEILDLIHHQQQDLGDTDRTTLASLEKVRPAKVISYFASMAKDRSGLSTLEKSSEGDWKQMLASLDEETQNHFVDGKSTQSSLIHYLL